MTGPDGPEPRSDRKWQIVEIGHGLARSRAAARPAEVMAARRSRLCVDDQGAMRPSEAYATGAQPCRHRVEVMQLNTSVC
jgi:hypothetical protein